jgi:hypothetical protein
MAIEQKIVEDHLRRKLILETNIDRTDLMRLFSTEDFYKEVYSQMAFMVADKLFKEVSPAIEKAFKDIANENPTN